MTGRKINLKPLAPDWDGMLRNLKNNETPDRVYFLEFGIAENIIDRFAVRYGLCDVNCTDMKIKRIKVHSFLGHELFRISFDGCTFPIPAYPENTAQSEQCHISDWADFEKFDWPDPAKADLSVLEFHERNIPPGMKVFHVLHIWEKVRDLLGYERFCVKLFEDPQLIEAVFDKVGSYSLKIVEAVCQFDCYGAVFLADDLGFKTSTMISPDDIRRYVIPWQRKAAEIAHGWNKFFFLHSCGQMYDLMPDYVNTVRIDAKHSFEDVILPIAEAKKKYGKDIALIGGLDVDFLCRSSEDSIRRKVREVIDACLPGGRFFFGSGNWVTEYVPFENYAAALEEARRSV